MAEGERTGWRLRSTNGYSALVGTAVSGTDGASPVLEVRLEARLPDDSDPAVAVATMPPSSLRTAKSIASLRAWPAQPLGAIASDPFETAADLADNARTRWNSHSTPVTTSSPPEGRSRDALTCATNFSMRASHSPATRPASKCCSTGWSNSASIRYSPLLLRETSSSAVLTRCSDATLVGLSAGVDVGAAMPAAASGCSRRSGRECL
jgi:hypothetical protein